MRLGGGEDEELEYLIRKKALELQKKMLLQREVERPRRVDPRSLVERHLTEDGKEMLERAREQYPRVCDVVVNELARLIAAGRISGRLDAVDIFNIFKSLGYPIRVETKIVIKRKGEEKSISEILREED